MQKKNLSSMQIMARDLFLRYIFDPSVETFLKNRINGMINKFDKI